MLRSYPTRQSALASSNPKEPQSSGHGPEQPTSKGKMPSNFHQRQSAFSLEASPSHKAKCLQTSIRGKVCSHWKQALLTRQNAFNFHQLLPSNLQRQSAFLLEASPSHMHVFSDFPLSLSLSLSLTLFMLCFLSVWHCSCFECLVLALTHIHRHHLTFSATLGPQHPGV